VDKYVDNLRALETCPKPSQRAQTHQTNQTHTAPQAVSSWGNLKGQFFRGCQKPRHNFTNLTKNGLQNLDANSSGNCPKWAKMTPKTRPKRANQMLEKGVKNRYNLDKPTTLGGSDKRGKKWN
jgi:hypothetical protein